MAGIRFRDYRILLSGCLRSRDFGKTCSDILILRPCLPKLPRRTHRGVASFLPIHDHKQLRKVEEMWYLILFLITDQLTACFLDAFRLDVCFR